MDDTFMMKKLLAVKQTDLAPHRDGGESPHLHFGKSWEALIAEM
ncbi:MAG: hypothetical protein ABW220_18100 [Burkholderiaceae bacterium]